ncbi:MAG: hypothetical protein A2Y39_02220 [Candidatus Delongbacteria bacterium GWF2_40_14]|nr:MAG: hypothetical protein A2Y39_02220 [Candidatus Delongbacteria bacterium GWF2_40_14]
MNDYKKIIETLSDKLSGNGLYYSGKEFNTAEASDFEASGLKVLICRLSTYRDTAQSFTHPVLYKLISGIGNCFADMAYLPPPPDIEVFRKNGIPLLIPTKTKADPLNFDVIAISNSLVQELLNIEVLLRESGIDTDHSTRIGREDQPLIILGGSNSANCHFLINDMSPIDLIYTGEDPENIVSLFSMIKELKLSGLKKAEIISRLFTEYPLVSPVRGENAIKNGLSSNYRKNIQPAGVPVLFKEDPHSTNLVISRGCPWFCSFCNESYRSKPYSEVSPEEIIKTGSEIRRLNGSEEVSLFSFNFNAHSKIEEVLGELHKQFRIVSLKSQRFDVLSLKSEFLKLLQFSGKTSITCGLEGISDRLRSYLSKDLSRIELEQSLRSLLESPIRTLKIFLIATGNETEEDINELKGLIKFIKDSVQNRPRPPRIVFSLTPLVRFPGTPIGIDQAYPISVVQKITDHVSKAVTSEDFEFRTANSEYEYWVSQVLLRNSSLEFYNAVQKAIKETGFLYFSAVDKKFYDRLTANLRTIDPDPDSFLNNNLNFRHFNSNIDENFISAAYGRAAGRKDTKTCNEIKGTAVCNACGACVTTEDRISATTYNKGAGLTVDRLKEIQAGYGRGTEISIPVYLRTKCAGLSNRYLGAVFTSALIRSFPEGEKHIRKLVRFTSRERFDNENLLGAEEAVYRCPPESLEMLTGVIQTDKFRTEFEKYAQGFGEIIQPVQIKNLIEIIVTDRTKKIDTSFMNKFHIKSTIIRISDGVYEAQVSKDGLKKKQFSKVLINIAESKIEVSYGNKFDLNDFIKILCESYKIRPLQLMYKIN